MSRHFVLSLVLCLLLPTLYPPYRLFLRIADSDKHELLEGILTGIFREEKGQEGKKNGGELFKSYAQAIFCKPRKV